MRIKQRAPFSKKRASDARLTIALNQQVEEEDELLTQMNLVLFTQKGWRLLGNVPGSESRIKVSIESSRYFIMQLRYQDDGVSSKRSPVIRFKNEQLRDFPNSICP